MEYNTTHQITPESIKKSVQETLVKQENLTTASVAECEENNYLSGKDAVRLIRNLEKQMHTAAKNLEFEKAAELRDRIKKIREKGLSIGV